MKKVIVTGASGYIGGQISLALKDSGYQVIGIDTVAPAHLNKNFVRFHQMDFGSDTAVQAIVEHRPDAIIHCAGTSLVGPSIADPQTYYNNNVVKTLRLLDAVVTKIPQTKFIFSSSAAVYGNPIVTPCHEVDPCYPISPYGESKRMVEMALQSYRQAYNLDFVAFRYFNACGADPQGRHGQQLGATHIIARALESIKDNEEFVLYGNDFGTNDGTCIRDYVHVEDIATAHVKALDKRIAPGIYNLGSQTGTSNLEILALCHEVTGKPVKVIAGPRRTGDPSVLTASDDKWSAAVGPWRQWSVKDTVQHAWNWYVRQNPQV